MLMAKRPHLSLVEYDKEARAKLKKRIADLGLTLVGLAGYSDFTAGIDKPGIPHTEIQAAYIGQLAELANDLGTKMIRIFTGYERPGVPVRQAICAGCRRYYTRSEGGAKVWSYSRRSESSRYCASPRRNVLDAQGD